MTRKQCQVGENYCKDRKCGSVFSDHSEAGYVATSRMINKSQRRHDTLSARCRDCLSVLVYSGAQQDNRSGEESHTVSEIIR